RGVALDRPLLQEADVDLAVQDPVLVGSVDHRRRVAYADGVELDRRCHQGVSSRGATVTVTGSPMVNGSGSSGRRWNGKVSSADPVSSVSPPHSIRTRTV